MAQKKFDTEEKRKAAGLINSHEFLASVFDGGLFTSEPVPMCWAKRWLYWLIRKPIPRRPVHRPDWPAATSDTITFRRPVPFAYQAPPLSELDTADPNCEVCEGTGWVCETHPGEPWDDGACCGGAGMPCFCNKLSTYPVLH